MLQAGEVARKKRTPEHRNATMGEHMNKFCSSVSAVMLRTFYNCWFVQDGKKKSTVKHLFRSPCSKFQHNTEAKMRFGRLTRLLSCFIADRWEQILRCKIYISTNIIYKGYHEFPKNLQTRREKCPLCHQNFLLITDWERTQCFIRAIVSSRTHSTKHASKN